MMETEISENEVSVLGVTSRDLADEVGSSLTVEVDWTASSELTEPPLDSLLFQLSQKIDQSFLEKPVGDCPPAITSHIYLRRATVASADGTLLGEGHLIFHLDENEQQRNSLADLSIRLEPPSGPRMRAIEAHYPNVPADGGSFVLSGTVFVDRTARGWARIAYLPGPVDLWRCDACAVVTSD